MCFARKVENMVMRFQSPLVYIKRQTIVVFGESNCIGYYVVKYVLYVWLVLDFTVPVNSSSHVKITWTSLTKQVTSTSCTIFSRKTDKVQVVLRNKDNSR